ncbi:hypothetical protein ES703_94027 [subsurface metagenome]
MLPETLIIANTKTPRQKMKLTPAEVSFYYHVEGKILREVGWLAGVSGSRIQQLMAEWKFDRRKPGTPKGKLKFTNLGAYLQHSCITGKQSLSILLRLAPPLKKCEICGSTRKLHLWSSSRPVRSARGLKILCSSCVWAKKLRGPDGLKQKEICRRYSSGEKTKDLAREFRVSQNRIYQILKRGRGERPKWC